MILVQIESILTPILVFDAPLVHIFRIFQLVLIVLLAIGLVAKSRKSQSAIVIIYSVLFVLANYFGRLQPGTLASG